MKLGYHGWYKDSGLKSWLNIGVINGVQAVLGLTHTAFSSDHLNLWSLGDLCRHVKYPVVYVSLWLWKQIGTGDIHLRVRKKYGIQKHGTAWD